MVRFGAQALLDNKLLGPTDIVFVQYPVNGDPDDPNKVVPNYAAADQLWAALEANAPLELTGKAGANGSVVDVTPTEEPAPEPTADPNATAAPTEAPAQDAAVLPNSISGSTAAQTTCSVGNLG